MCGKFNVIAEEPPAESEPVVQVSESSIPFKQVPSTPQGTYSRVATALVVIIGLSLLVIFVLRRQLVKRGLLSDSNDVRILVSASKRLTPKLNVFLIEVDNKSYLLAHSGNNIQMINHDSNRVSDVVTDE